MRAGNHLPFVSPPCCRRYAWASAQAWCEDNGGSLVTIASATDMELAKEALALDGRRRGVAPGYAFAWIGRYRVTYRRGNIYRWISGTGDETSTYTDWYTIAKGGDVDEPTHTDAHERMSCPENCVGMLEGGW